MKIKKSTTITTGIIILLFLIQAVFYACPKCDQDFYSQLTEQDGNVLGKQELLEAIKNQTLPGDTVPFVKLASYIEDSSSITCNINNSNNTETESYFSYVIFFIQLNLFEGL